ncbi:hypothetical protein Tco_0582290, partial [Tanacetum coccineum]
PQQASAEPMTETYHQQHVHLESRDHLLTSWQGVKARQHQ